jgi:hypothetical protein
MYRYGCTVQTDIQAELEPEEKLQTEQTPSRRRPHVDHDDHDDGEDESSHKE